MLALLLVGLGVGLSLVMAYLAVKGLWPVALGLLLALPAFVLVHRYPLVGLIIWLLLAPFLVETNGGTFRKIYWVIHRTLPVATLGVVILSALFRIHRRTLPRLGWAELFMAGYIFVTLLSILYFTDDVMGRSYQLYDRVFVPMCLYLLIRLTNPTEQDLKRLLPVVIFILVSQSIIGILSWLTPQVLPSVWLSRAGTRTTGSFGAYSVFSSTVVFCGVLLLQSAFTHDLSKKLRLTYILLFILALFMVFLSFSRGSWLAGLVVFMGLVYLYPRLMLRLGLSVTIIAFVLLLLVGPLANQIDLSYAKQRFYSDNSEQTALSRLPVYYASYRMFVTKPLFGWGYGNFDKYDRQFQERVGDLVTPEKDHASHNVYLTLIAEQGLTGFLLFLAPMFWWLALSLKAMFKMPAEGFWSRSLLIIFWLVIANHFIVNNFSNMRVVFGLGMWWITLGFIAVMVTPHLSSDEHDAPVRVESGRPTSKPRPQPVHPLLNIDGMGGTYE